MKIRDLEYMESLSAEKSRVSGGQDFFVTFDKLLISNHDSTQNYTVDVNVNKVIQKDIQINQDVDINGNVANGVFDVEAYGFYTLADLEVNSLTIEGELSSIAALVESVSYNPMAAAANGVG